MNTTLSVIIAIILCGIIGYALETGKPWTLGGTFDRLMKGIYTPMSTEEFNMLSPDQKRMVVARDVIFQLNRGKTSALTGKSVDAPYKLRNRAVSIKDWMRDAIGDYNDLKCEACAKGNLFLSYIGYVNEVDFGCSLTNRTGSTFNEKLLELFSKPQVDLIEMAFEGYDGYPWIGIIPEEDRQKAFRFYDNNKSNENMRLIAICRNIIHNKGTFMP